MIKYDEAPPPCTKELYARSVNSSNLADNAQSHHTDRLSAMALSRNLRLDDTPEQRVKKLTESELGQLLFRAKYANDESSLSPLVIAWRAKVSKRAERRGWKDVAQTVADESLHYWMDDTCTVCHGRSAPKIENTPMLSDIICPECNGSAKRPLRVDCTISDYVRDAIETLNSLEREAGSLAIKKLAGDFRL